MITVLSGGSGGGKFLQGMVRVMDEDAIAVIANTGDDVEFYDLHISPDVDIIIYHLAGVADETRGWGIQGDTFDTLRALERFGYETWFNLGDRDMATHIHRTLMLRRGHSLTEATASIVTAFGLRLRMLPMSDQRVTTRVVTPGGTIGFQEFWVKNGAMAKVLGVEYDGAESAQPAPGVLEAILEAEAVIIGPSHPLFSIGPILAVPGVRQALRDTTAKVVAVSPIVTSISFQYADEQIMEDLGMEVTPYQVAQLYRDFADVFVIDPSDADQREKIEALGMSVIVTPVLMPDRPARINLARETLRAVRGRR